MTTSENQNHDAQDNAHSSSRRNGIDPDEIEGSDFATAERCLEVLMLANHYRVPDSILLDTCKGLGISRALLLFKNSKISPPIFWNGSETVFTGIDDDCISTILEHASDYFDEFVEGRGCESHLSFLKEAPFNFDCPVAYLIGPLEGLLIIDSREQLSQHARTTIAAIGWLLETQILRHQLSREKHIDWMTGLPVQWYFEKACQLQIQIAETLSSPLSLALVDIDELKRANDLLGLSVGDYVIEVVAQRLRAYLPETILCARIGGNRFAVLGQGYSAMKLFGIMESVRIRISTPIEITHLSRHSPPNLVPTVSVGIVEWKEPGTTYGEILERADKALLQAKGRGRNQSSIN